jgi:hypothetical protein
MGSGGPGVTQDLEEVMIVNVEEVRSAGSCEKIGNGAPSLPALSPGVGLAGRAVIWREQFLTAEEEP